MRPLCKCSKCARIVLKNMIFSLIVYTKSQVLLFSTPLTRKLKPVIKLNNQVIEYVSNAVHLGSVIGRGSDHANLSKAANDLYVRSNSLLTHFKYVSYNVICNLFNTYCSSFYGSSLWNLNSIDSLCVAYRKCIRFILRIPYRTHSRYVHYLINRADLVTQLMIRFVNFLHKCFNSENEIVSLCCSVAVLPLSTSNVSNNLNLIVEKWDISRTSFFFCKCK